jgi:diadenosine tetraphosphatase ApaH/serine/threonine PP2A family protein phosphatase
VTVAVLSDIHANLVALQSALALAEQRGADRLVCLGDVVGYGPDPGPCVDLVRAEFEVCVKGNHDEAVVGSDGEARALPRDGQAAARLHRELLTEDQAAWLRALPFRAEAHGATYVHAAPRHPERWPRLESFGQVKAQFDAFETPICFVGHSHRPAVVSESVGVLRVRPGHRYLVDVGSVGQPRDKDPRLSFALYDPEAFSVEVVRGHYDHARVAVRVGEVGLPASLGDRLRRGV